MNTVRLLGVVQLIVVVGAVITERLLVSAVGSGSMSDMLVNISNNLTRMRISSLAALGQSVAIVVLGVLYYVVFGKEYKIISLVALGLFLAAAIILAVSKIGAYGLIPLSQEFVEAGAPVPSYFQTLGDTLYHAVDRQGNNIFMLFTCLSFLLWNYLFYTSRVIPRALSVWALVAICLLLITVLLVLYNRDFRESPAMMLAIPYAPI
ncbi:DUF4386 domain-containing protein [Chloroflexota bacterium]